MQLLSVQPDIEIICSDARENFEQNKLSLARKAEKEDNLKVQLLLRRDIKFLDDIQLQMSTAREFMFAYRVSRATEQSFAELNRLEKQINEQGFDCKRARRTESYGTTAVREIIIVILDFNRKRERLWWCFQIFRQATAYLLQFWE